LDAYKDKISSLAIIPSSGGVFEVSLDGRKVFSKKETGRFPEFDELAPHLEGTGKKRKVKAAR
jgi:selenoprotein W-related protein